MKNRIKLALYRPEHILFVLVFALVCCERPEHIVKITTLPPEEALISYSTATLKGEIVDLGSAPIEEYGIAISKSSAFLNAETKTVPTQASKGTFQVQFTNLDKNCEYNYKAYILTNGTVLYSNVKQKFTTKDSQSATVVSGYPIEITAFSARLQGEVTSDGGEPVTVRGFCWSASANPTIGNCIDTMNCGSGPGNFSGLIQGLYKGTIYYVRAYAINGKGVSYSGSDIQFATHTEPTVVTRPVIPTSPDAATGGGDVTFNGGAEVSERGVCWNTTGNPTTADSKTNDDGGSGIFSSFLTGLLSGTRYYVRAYAINAVGTVYGEQVIFNTKVADVDGNFYNTVTIGTQVWMAENLKTTKYNDGTPIDLITDNTQWQTLTTPRYCWYNNDEATYKDLYGALYFVGINTYPDPSWWGTKNICPAGWIIPTIEMDLVTLFNLFGGAFEAGGKLKEAGYQHWVSPNEGATNESGFTALPGGYRGSDGLFYRVGSEGAWWTRERMTPSSSYRVIHMTSDTTEVLISGSYYQGHSIRCFKNN